MRNPTGRQSYDFSLPTRALLLVVALGLWANVLTAWFRPAPVLAQSDLVDRMAVSQMMRDVRAIKDDTASMRGYLREMAINYPPRPR